MPFRIRQFSTNNPSARLIAITPHDTNEIEPIRAIYVGTGGDLTVLPDENTDGNTVTLTNIPDGTLLPIAVRLVMESSTASDLVGLV